jgi:uncharacterized membrane protein YkgB
VNTAATAATAAPIRLERLGITIGTVSLVLIYLAFGLSKFTPEEATALVGIVKPSPFLGWTYAVMSETQFSMLLGVIELSIGALIALRPFAPRLAFTGAMLSAGLFLMTQSFLLSTPGVFDASRGLFGFFGGAGQFLLKDAGLFALSLLVAADARRAMAG